MVNSEKLEETVLWRVYQGKVSPNEKRSSWVKYSKRGNCFMENGVKVLSEYRFERAKEMLDAARQNLNIN